jgi:hypothetical protein
MVGGLLWPHVPLASLVGEPRRARAPPASTTDPGEAHRLLMVNVVCRERTNFRRTTMRPMF